MLKRIAIVLACLISSVLVISCSAIKRPSVVKNTDHYQIINVNVVDVINEKINNHSRVEVKHGKIIAIDNKPNSQANIVTIDGTGKFLIPGLWDNHSSLLYFSPEVDYPLYIANGVTSIRSNLSCPNENEVSFYACMKDKAAWQQAVTAGEMLGPNLYGWGTFPVNGYKRKQHSDLPSFAGGTTPQESIKIVEHYNAYPNELRPHFIKVYNWLPEGAYQALTKYALEQGFEIAGHKPRAVTIKAAVDAGQRSFAHARLFLYDCSHQAEQIRAGIHRKSKLTTFYPYLMENYDQAGCQKTFEYMAEKGVYLNPTLITRRNDYYGVAGKYDQMLGIDYAHYLVKREWREDIEKYGTALSAEQIDIFESFYHLSAKTIADAHHHGVTLLAGTDSWSEYNVPGFSLHEELAALSEAGIDNFSVLQAASINGARYFGIDTQTGSIDIGKNADMVLLNANPITNIKNTQNIDIVFKSEHIYQQEHIQTLKADVKDIANSHLFTAKLLLRMARNPSGF